MKRTRDVKRGYADRRGMRTLHAGEVCFVYRMQARERLQSVAKDLGVSHVALIRWERGMGQVERLVEYWNARQA